MNPIEKDMAFKLIRIENSMVPAIYPQSWNDEIEDWVVTSEKNPLIIDLKDKDEFIEFMQGFKDNGEESTRLLNEITTKLQDLLNESFRTDYLTPMQVKITKGSDLFGRTMEREKPSRGRE